MYSLHNKPPKTKKYVNFNKDVEFLGKKETPDPDPEPENRCMSTRSANFIDVSADGHVSVHKIQLPSRRECLKREANTKYCTPCTITSEPCKSTVTQLIGERKVLSEQVSGLQGQLKVLKTPKSCLKNTSSTKWVPYFFNRKFITHDSQTNLIGNKLNIVVWLAGVNNPPIYIYPFGDGIEPDLNWDKEIKVSFTSGYSDIGYCKGSCKVMGNRKILSLHGYSINGSSITFNEIDLPALFKASFE